MNDAKGLRDRARQCHELAKTARDEPMRLMLEQMSEDLDQEADEDERRWEDRLKRVQNAKLDGDPPPRSVLRIKTDTGHAKGDIEN